MAWESRIIDISNDYMPESAKEDQPPVQVVFLALPLDGALKLANVRQDYRLSAEKHNRVAIRTNLAARDTRLVNFSAGGATITMPGEPRMEPGFRMYVQLVFPWPGERVRSAVKSKAEVVRVDYNRGEDRTRVGLHFLEMDGETRRTFGQIIHHYMLAKQRMRQAGDL